ncbi:MAG: CNNM domain-containing protein, partial [Parvibaculum sp.]
MLSFGLGVILGAIVLLLLFSAFFSGSETALTAASRARMHHLAEEGNKRARTVLRLTEDRERLIGAILLGNNLVNILASALATSLFLALFGDAGVVYATLVMTAVVLIFAEVAPKTFAITNTDRVALAVSRPLRLITVLFGPVTAAVQFIVRHTFRVFGLNVDDSQQVLSAHEELRGAINLHHHEGSVVKIDR